ncbi:Aste57867_21258 [Aphanomyces stellatus]|uniref:Aste57867_21258 protein n=1 Tax=Aphanomyces stellatus TaxID=120398 RepID=A0A485LJ56_9STRA|nr:hypothetical protein As57867_021189 [Aphanomyces stellatus]VFT97930.1 Aste57867_21258 [Aphanomyces stellatus]
MATTLQTFKQLTGTLWTTLAAAPNPWPLQSVLVITFLVCLGLHYDFLFPSSLKDSVCLSAMCYTNGRPSACTTRIKYLNTIWVAAGLQLVAFLLLR